MPPKKKSNNTTPIDTVKHKEKRVNIPTEELRDFVKEDEAKPKTILYPSDPSLDPQLVWKGKRESAWSMLYSTMSVPFDTPEKGKIAVKVINHYGDEVLKVYEVK